MPKTAIDAWQQYSKGRPCPICGNACAGHLSEDGSVAHCAQPVLAGALARAANDALYPHKLRERCACGSDHQPGPPPTAKPAAATGSYETGGPSKAQAPPGSRPPPTRPAAPARNPQKGPCAATKLVQLVGDIELFRTPNGRAWATFSPNAHKESHPLKSQVFKDWLARKFYQAEGSAPSAQAINSALGVLSGRALAESKTIPVHTRVAHTDEAIYIDLCDDEHRVVEITRDGWRVIEDPGVKFRRAAGMLPLPVPQRGGSLDLLWAIVNVERDDRPLIAGWLVMGYQGRGACPILAIQGEQGSAKSTTSRMLRALVDPNAAPLRAEPRSARDLMITATTGWIMAFDNLSTIDPKLADMLCRLVTGGGFATRALFTDEEETLFEAKRAILFNGIEELATRPDLIDRSIVVYLPMIPASKRRTEKEVMEEFEAARPGILGALFDGIACALRELPGVRLAETPRMADFAHWATAAETALGFHRGATMQAYERNREIGHHQALDASPLSEALREVAGQGGFTGIMSELLTLVNGKVTDEQRRQREWPKNARALSSAMRRMSTSLRAVGVDVAFDASPTGPDRRRQVHVYQLPIALEAMEAEVAIRTEPGETPEEVDDAIRKIANPDGSEKPE